ncbi:MarR family transcriptional regulator [Candidatus Bipolaricaulota bacterium]|nr:MarR family transcriptional regulator [Candidatus Bipolaricaulota bacterium]
MSQEVPIGQKPGHEMTVGQLLAQVCRMTGERLRVHMEKLGLHRGQGFALIHLWHHDGVPQRELSQAMHVSPASVTTMLQRMERDGWIDRQRDEADQRVVRVFLTKKSKGLRAKARTVFREMEEELASVYTDAERETLERLLMKLHDRFAPDDSHTHDVHRFLFGEDEESAGPKNSGEGSE